MAKDTEKLIRQLSLISYLMAERRPVTALEIRRDVEGYSGMNEEAFARRFYADRSELDALGIHLTVNGPSDAAEQENYSLRPEAFHLPAIAFTDTELAALQTSLTLLDGEFAYAEPLRLALQQISWGRPSPLEAPDQRSVALGITASAGGHEHSQRLTKVETAVFRAKTITFDYYTMARDETGPRKVDPYCLLFRGGQFYLLGHSHERGALRVFRLSRIRGKVAYASKAEHDFRRPADFDPRSYANRAEWQFGSPVGTARIHVSGRIAWQVERHFGAFGTVMPAEDAAETNGADAAGTGEEAIVFETPYADARLLAAWLLRFGEHARVLGPPELEREVAERVELLHARHAGELVVADEAPVAQGAGEEGEPTGRERRSKPADSVIRPERFARLVTLASILIEAGRRGEAPEATDVCERLQLSESELREDIAVLNVVSFGGGTYVLYAELTDDGRIEVDPEPYADNFARPARLLPVEAKALVFAIDLLGVHLHPGLLSARERLVGVLGHDPTDHGLVVAAAGADDSEMAALVSRAIADRRVLELDYYKANEDEFSPRTIEPYALTNGREGWYVAGFDLEREAVRHFRLDRIRRAEVLERTFEPRPEVDPAAGVDGWLRTGEVEASRIARVWVSPQRARWAREERRVHRELSDGAVVVEVAYAGTDWLVREVLSEAGDAAVLEPAEAREAVLAAVERLRPVASR